MATHTVRFDAEAEQTLAEITSATGLSVSAVLKKGLIVLREQIEQENAVSPYEVYQQLDLGPGGYVDTASTQTKDAAREKIRQKIRQKIQR